MWLLNYNFSWKCYVKSGINYWVLCKYFTKRLFYRFHFFIDSVYKTWRSYWITILARNMRKEGSITEFLVNILLNIYYEATDIFRYLFSSHICHITISIYHRTSSIFHNSSSNRLRLNSNYHRSRLRTSLIEQFAHR